jgi:hypothetical protein
LGATPIEQVRHSPTCSRRARFDLERQFARDRNLALGTHQAARHLVDRRDLVDRQAGADGRENSLLIIGVEPMINLDRDDVRAQLPGLVHKRAGLDAESFGGVAGSDREGRIRWRLHDDRLAA